MTGIQETFLQIAQHLIQLYENVPNCGMQVLESYNYQDQNNLTSRHNLNHSLTVSGASDHQGEQKSGGCCS